MQTMEALVDAGLVKHIGLSNFSLEQLQAAQASLRNSPIVSNQVLYNLNQRSIEADVLPYCLEQKITIIAYTPLDDGRLATPAWFPHDYRLRALEQVAAFSQKTPAQVALNWCTAHANVVVIPKSNNSARIVENCGASGWRLSPEQVQYLNHIFA